MLLARECGEHECGLEQVVAQRWLFLGADPNRDMELSPMQGVDFVDICTPTGELLLCGGGGEDPTTGAFAAAIAIYKLSLPHQAPRDAPIVSLVGGDVCPYASVTGKWMPNDPVLFVLGGGKAEVSVWDSAHFAAVQRTNLAAEGGRITALDMSPAPGAQAGLVAAADDQSHQVKLVDLASGAAAHQLEGHSGYVSDVRWSPTNPHMLASAAKDGVRLFDVRRSGKTACLLKFNEFRKMPDVEWGLDILGRCDRSDEIRQPCTKRRGAKATAPQFSKQIEWQTSPLLGLGCAWTAASTLQQRRRIKRAALAAVPNATDGKMAPTAIRFSPNGTTVVTASRKGEHQIFDVLTGRLIAEHRDGTSGGKSTVFEVARDNYHILGGRFGHLYAVGLDTGEYLWERIGHGGRDMSAMAIHPVNEEVYSVSGTTLNCWSCGSGQVGEYG